ncbi:MAG TPA: CARDB domain-containing protein, partial [Candidatus Cloacimonadota bacterium]|nr:CARDB domain-containing protein [Candidatus Cloacimonadota bacterium]
MKKPILFCIFLLIANLSVCTALQKEQVGVSRTTLTWTGALSSDWNTPSNWTPYTAPTPIYDVVIPAGLFRYPYLDTDTGTCHDLTLANGASITLGDWLGAAPLFVYGNAYMAGLLNIHEMDSFTVYGDIVWQSGATEDITVDAAYINCYGNMTFDSGSVIHFLQGVVSFYGDDSAVLTNNSIYTTFTHFQVFNMYPASLTISSSSTQNITIRDDLFMANNKLVKVEYSGSIIIRGDIVNNYTTTGGLICSAGTIVMDGYQQSIYMDGYQQSIYMDGSSSYFNNLIISPQSDDNTSTLHTPMIVKGNLTIEHGTLDSQSNTITVGGDWINLRSPSAFTEGTSRIIFNGSGEQYCNHSENFGTLEVNKAGGNLRINSSTAAITCTSYDWTAGGIMVLAGSFTAGDLADDCIKGKWYLYSGGTINLTSDNKVDLGGDLNIYGGNFNVYGGVSASYWPYTSAGSITMIGGILDFKNQGVYLSYFGDFTDNISGGVIRVSRGFDGIRTDFNPTGGTIELYGSTDASVSHAAGSNFYNLDINKTAGKGGEYDQAYKTERSGNVKPLTRSNAVYANSNLDINGFFKLEAGTFVAPAQINVAGAWYNDAGPLAFTEGTGLVVFDGTASVYVYGETFNNLELNKTGTAYISVIDGYNVTCNSYNWTSGKLYVSGGSFTALDLADAYIGGYIDLTGGVINFHQDVSSYFDLQATLNISGGELHLYGGMGDTLWPYGGNASLTMNNGVINVHDINLYIYTGNTFTNNITGGTIRVGKGFYCNRADFLPTGGTLEMYSTTDAYLEVSAGRLYNLDIKKASPSAAISNTDIIPVTFDRQGNQIRETRGNIVYLNAALICGNDVTISSGRLDTNGKTLNCAGIININSGILEVDAVSVLIMASTKGINVNNGGRLEVLGNSTNTARITHSTGYYYLDVYPGGTIAATYATFEYLRTDGVNVKAGATVDSGYSFAFCTFRYGTIFGTLLTIDNSQNLLINGAVFPTNTWTGNNNVRKNVNTGVINFATATGGFAGESYDYDLNNRIVWTAPTASYDLQILKAEYSKPSSPVGQTVTLKVTLLNMSTTNCTVASNFLDYYESRTTAPTAHLAGNQWITVTSLVAGLPTDFTFTVTNPLPSGAGTWNSWLQIDTDQYVTESNETNNIYGPFQIIWVYLPPITDITIIRSGMSQVLMHWNYSTVCDRYGVYRSTNPNFTPSPENNVAWITYPEHTYLDTISNKYFYIVTAVLDDPLKIQQRMQNLNLPIMEMS